MIAVEWLPKALWDGTIHMNRFHGIFPKLSMRNLVSDNPVMSLLLDQGAIFFRYGSI